MADLYGDDERQHSEGRSVVESNTWDWITDRIAVGSGVDSRDGVCGRAHDGITHVIDCRVSAWAERHYRGSGVEFFHNPTHDDGSEQPAEWFHRGINYALGVLAKPGTKLLIHCAAGINRSPSLTYAVLRALGYDRTAAVAAIETARPVARVRYLHDAERALAAR